MFGVSNPPTPNITSNGPPLGWGVPYPKHQDFTVKSLCLGLGTPPLGWGVPYPRKVKNAK